MFQQLYDNVYHSDLIILTAAVLLLVLVWSVFGALIPKKMRVISAAAAALCAVVILSITIFTRGDVDVISELMPFALLSKSFHDPAIFRSVVMNVFLFVPLGMSLPFVIQSASSRRIPIAILIGFLLSGMIELLQHFLLVGMMQTDDVICNTLGTALGSCAYPLSLLWQKMFRKKTK